MMFSIVGFFSSYAFGLEDSGSASNQTRHRPILYGFDDCSDADTIARSYNGCGIPVPTFSCSDLNEGGKICLDKCMNEDRCDFFSIIFDDKKSTCRCSMRSTASLIASTRVTVPEDKDTGDCKKNLNISSFVCSDNHLIDKRVSKLENCDGDIGCAYHTNKGFTVAKVADDWSLIDTCTIRVSASLRNKAKRDRETGGKGEGWSGDDQGVVEAQNAIMDVEDQVLPGLSVVEGGDIHKAKRLPKNRELKELLQGMGGFSSLDAMDTGPGLFGHEGERKPIQNIDVKKTKFPRVRAKKVKAEEGKKDERQAEERIEIVDNVTVHEKFTNVTGDIHDVITANFTDVVTFNHYTGSERTWYNTGTDNGCPADCPCKCKKKGTCDCEIEVDIAVEAVIDVNMPDCSDKDKEDCGGGCNGKKFKSDASS